MHNRVRLFALSSILAAAALAAVACGGGVNTNGATTGTPTPSGTHTPTPTPTGTSTNPTPTPTATGTPADATCVSNNYWILGDLGSDWMHPGTDCPTCHATNNGPEFWVAGTVYGANDQIDDCGGVQNVEVDVKDASGTVYPLQTNLWGNFYLKQSDAPGFQTPYTVSLTFNGQTRTMASSQTSQGCNSCHTQTGANSAPGRILEPGI